MRTHERTNHIYVIRRPISLFFGAQFCILLMHCYEVARRFRD